MRHSSLHKAISLGAIFSLVLFMVAIEVEAALWAGWRRWLLIEILDGIRRSDGRKERFDVATDRRPPS